MTATKPHHHYAMTIRTQRGTVTRYYRNRTLSQAIIQAENRADCLEVMRAIEITAAQYEAGMKQSDQTKPFRSVVGLIRRNQNAPARN
jgi:hypothetical protein